MTDGPVSDASWWLADAARPRVPAPTDDKYSRGVLGVRTGSDAYPGAAVLGVEAAWRTGLGMVRYVGPDRAAWLVLQRRPETVTGVGRVQAWVIGSGTDAARRSAAETRALRDILTGSVPVVADAGALDLVAATRTHATSRTAAPLLVTPHASEHDALRRSLGLPSVPPDADDAAREASAVETARALGACVLLKGSVTVVAAPSGASVRVSTETAWLATAGTGDVLAGAIGALVAGAAAGGGPGVDRELDAEALLPLAVAGALLHGRAAWLAAADLGPEGGPITALDVAEAIPRAVAEVLAMGHG